MSVAKEIAWNLSSSVTVNCCDITSIKYEIKYLEVLSTLEVDNSN